MKTRITKTLLDSWAYTFDCYEGGEEDAMNDFLKTLNREPIEENEAIANGKAFEGLCFRIANGEKVYEEKLAGELIPDAVASEIIEPNTGDPKIIRSYPKWYNGAKKIADIVKGGQWQVHVDTDLQIGDRTFWLHGFCDVVKAGVIYDIKFKAKSFGSLDLYGSYRGHSQHSAYLRCLPEAYEFVYLVSDGEDLYTEAYNRHTCRPIEEIISDFMNWLESKPELLKIYEEKWVVDG